MNKKILYKIILLLNVMLIICIFSPKVYASSGSANANIGKTSLKVGETTKLTVTATNSFIGYNMKSSDSSIVSISASSDEIDSDYEKTDSKSYTVTAKKAGKATISVVSYTASGYDEKKFSLSKSFTITVTEPSNNNKNTNNSKSPDATLKSITVGGKTYSKPSTSITAPNVSASTSSITIKATTNNSKAKVSGTGTKDLKPGTNKFTLKVTAENGDTKPYYVTVIRLTEEDSQPNLPDESNNEEQNNGLKLTSLQIEGVDISPSFREDLFEYSAYIFDLNEVKVNAISNDQEAKIEITGNTGLIEGENIILVKLTKGENTVEYKIKVTKMKLEEQEEQQSDIAEEQPKTSKIGELWNKYGTAMTIYSTTLIITRNCNWICNNSI